MGSVKSTRITVNNKIEYRVSIDYEESLLLKGHVTNMHIFSQDSADIEANILARGKGDTKYLRIPKILSYDITTSKKVKCMRIDSKDKIILCTVIDK